MIEKWLNSDVFAFSEGNRMSRVKYECYYLRSQHKKHPLLVLCDRWV